MRARDGPANLVRSEPMGIDAYGWVEVYDAEDDTWDGVILATQLMERDVHIFCELFGMGTHSPTDKEPLAAHRGFPENASLQATEEKGLSGQWRSRTWVSWQELAAWGAAEREFGSRWHVLFALMATLARTYDDDAVRLVVSFD